MKWGAYMCGEHVRKRVKFVRTCCKAPTCSCFVSLSKSNMSQPAQRDFWWKKLLVIAGDQMFTTTRWNQSQINLDQWKAYFRKAPQTMAVKSPKLVYEDGQFHQRIRKRPWNSLPWSENVLGQNDGQISFIRNEPVFPGVSNSIILTLPRSLQAESGSKHPIWPPKNPCQVNRVKNVLENPPYFFSWWNGQSQFVGCSIINQASCTLYLLYIYCI